MASKAMFRVHVLSDPYFGRTITSKPEEIFKALKFYAQENGWVPFEYNDWYGSTYHIKGRISKILLTQYNCYAEVEVTRSIPDHYIPTPYDCIERRYIGSCCKGEPRATETIIDQWEA